MSTMTGNGYAIALLDEVFVKVARDWMRCVGKIFTKDFFGKATQFVIPAKAGIQELFIKSLDSGSSPE